MTANFALTHLVDADTVPHMMDGTFAKNRRFRNRWGLLCFCTLVSCLVAEQFSAAQEFPPPAASSDEAEGIVLLKNGQLLMGQAIASVDRTVVSTKSGSQIILKTDDIRFICRSWKEAWEHQRDAVDIDNPQELIDLLQWCLRHHLLVEGRQVINQLQYTKIRPTDLDHFHRMLVSAEKSHESEQRRRIESKTASMIAGGNTTGATVPVERIQDRKIAPASFISESGPESLNPVVATAVLDDFSARIPDAALEDWRHQVEPLLLRSCGNAGCHGANDLHLPLMSIGHEHQPPLRMSQQNLYWTARQLFAGQSGCETFLKMTGSAHGGQPAPPIRPDSNEFERIRHWAQEFCSQTSAVMPDFNQKSNPEQKPVESIQIPGAAVSSLGLPQRSAERDAPRIPATALPMLEFPKIPDLANTSSKFVPIDEFDPQIFNRFLRESETASRNQARSLGLPDLQSLLGKEKAPEK